MKVNIFVEKRAPFKFSLLAVLCILAITKAVIAGGTAGGNQAGQSYQQVFTIPTSAPKDGPLLKRLQESIIEGSLQSVINNTNQTTSVFLGLIPANIKHLSTLLGAYLYRMAFGSAGLGWNSLAKINNRICTFCLPFTKVSAGTRDKKRRAELVDMGQTGLQVTELTENNWQVVQLELIKELYHAIEFLKRSTGSYDKSYEDASYFSLRFQLGRMLHAFAPHDNIEVCFYIERTVCYLEKLIELIRSVNSFEDVEQRSEYINRWLGWTCNSFEQVALLLEGENVSRMNKLTFTKPTMQSGSSAGGMSQLADLLGTGPSLQL